MSRRRYQHRQACAPAAFEQPITVSLNYEKEEKEENQSATPGLRSILKKRPSQSEIEVEPEVVSRKQKRKAAFSGGETEKRIKEETAPKKKFLFITVGTYDCSLAGYIHDPSLKRLQTLFAMKPHTGYITDLTLTDKWLLCSSMDETISVYNAKKLKEVGTCGSEGSVTKMMFVTPTNLLVGTDSGVLEIMRSSDWMTIWKEHAHKKSINDITVHPSGSLGITVGEDCFMKFWDFRKCKLMLQVKLPRPATLVSFCPSGSTFVSATEKCLTLSSTDTGKELTQITLTEEIKCIRFVDDDHLLVGLEEGSLQLLRVTPTSISSVWSQDAHPSRVRSIAFAPSETEGTCHALVTVCSGGCLVVWDLCPKTFKLTEVRRVSHGTRYTAVSASWRA